MRLPAALIAAILALSGAPAAGGSTAGAGDGAAQTAAKKKCKKKKRGVPRKKRRCKKVKKIPSVVTINNCPTAPVPGATPVTLTGTLTPDPKGNSPLGAIWESTPAAAGGNDSISFFTSPGGAFSFTFVSKNPGTGSDWTTLVRVDFAGDILFADRRPSSASCSFTSTA